MMAPTCQTWKVPLGQRESLCNSFGFPRQRFGISPPMFAAEAPMAVNPDQPRFA
jgi:hypothetical protein